MSQVQARNSLARQINPWVVVSLLALAGWTVDSLLVALKLHNLPGVGLQVHRSHLWYGPLLLAATLLIVRQRRPRMAFRPPNGPASNDLTHGLRPQVKLLATHVTGSDTKAALLAFFRRYSGIALRAPDLAYHIGREPAAVEQALAELVTLGLVERQYACDLSFYRLTEDEQRLAQLDELVAWQESWLEQARRLTQAVGPSLLVRNGRG